MAQHARFGRELLDDRRPLVGERLRGRRPTGCAPRYASRKWLHEEVQFPRQLLDVEGDAVRDDSGPTSARAPRRCSVSMSATRLAVERRVLGRLAAPRCAWSVTSPRSCSARMPSASEWPRIAGTGSGICCEQFGDVGERQRAEVDRSGVQREHDRRAVVQKHAEVAAVGRIAGERHDARVSGRQSAFAADSVSMRLLVWRVGGAFISWSVHHERRDDRAAIRRAHQDLPVVACPRWHDDTVGHDTFIELAASPTSTSSQRIDRVDVRRAVEASTCAASLRRRRRLLRCLPVVRDGANIPEVGVADERRGSIQVLERAVVRTVRRSN